MHYKEKIIDLFEVENDYYLAHCISADFAMGKGIAVEFNKRFDIKRKLSVRYPNFIEHWRINDIHGDCILIDGVFNLITKELYYEKPTYRSMRYALQKMKNICFEKNISKLAMPMIGCGLDKLKWERVSNLIKEIFADTDFEILICKKVKEIKV